MTHLRKLDVRDKNRNGLFVRCLVSSSTLTTMAHNREWDRGKDVWNDSYSWPQQEQDDEYYSDGKRRKFNNGVCGLMFSYNLPLTVIQGYDSSQGYGETNFSNDQENHNNDWSQDFGAEDRSRAGGFPKKRLVPSERSPHVIFLGLDPDFSEADVCCILYYSILFNPKTESLSYPASGLFVIEWLQY